MPFVVVGGERLCGVYFFQTHLSSGVSGGFGGFRGCGGRGTLTVGTAARIGRGGRKPAASLVDLDTGHGVKPVRGVFEVDLDRKSAAVYRVL